MWLPELLLLATGALADEPEVVVTFDNGGFNAPFYAPRWSGFARPSTASEVAASIARVAGENPEVWTYLPPGRVEGRPGDATRIEPRRKDCIGAAAAPTDPCWCPAGDLCWGELGANRHPAGSTSLYLTASRVREGGRGPRLEIHFTDLFEEDPSTAEDPADSDRCVTRSGVRKAIGGLLQSDHGSVDHIAVGLLRAQIEPPPPNSDVGSLFRFEETQGACWSGQRTGSWTQGQGSLDWGMAVVVVGLDTAPVHDRVAELLDGLRTQLGTETMEITLATLREPVATRRAEGSLSAPDLGRWQAPTGGDQLTAPCSEVSAEPDLAIDGLQLPDISATADCEGRLVLGLPTSALRASWARVHGMSPLAPNGRLTGRVAVRGTPGATLDRMGELVAANRAITGRSLVLFTVLEELAQKDAAPYAWDLEVDVEVADVDGRPWLLALAAGVAFALAGALATNKFLLRTQASRAYQAAWDRAVDADDDPLRQRPVAAVIAEAQEEVRARWAGRWAFAAVLSLLFGLFAAFLVLRIHLVSLG